MPSITSIAAQWIPWFCLTATPLAGLSDITMPGFGLVAVGVGGSLGGLPVAGACSVDPGADGTYGTSDDLYTDTVSGVTDADGRFEMELEGEACWLSAAPPLPPDAAPVPAPEVTGSSVQQQSLPPVPALANAVVLDLSATDAPAVLRIERASAVSRPLPPPDADQLNGSTTTTTSADGRRDVLPALLLGGLALVLAVSLILAGRPTGRLRHLTWR